MKDVVLIFSFFINLFVAIAAHSQTTSAVRFSSLANFWKQARFSESQENSECNQMVELVQKTESVLKLRGDANDLSKCPSDAEFLPIADAKAKACFDHLDQVFNRHFKQNPKLEPAAMKCKESRWYEAQKNLIPEPQSPIIAQDEGNLAISCTPIVIEDQTFRAVIQREKNQPTKTVCSGRYKCRESSSKAPVIFGGYNIGTGTFQFHCAMPEGESCESVNITNCQQLAYYEYGNLDAFFNYKQPDSRWKRGDMTPVKQPADKTGARK